MKDKDEPKRPTICSHQEAERPTPSSEQITHRRHHHPPKTAAVLLAAVLHNSSRPSRRARDKNTGCLAAGRDITQGWRNHRRTYKPPVWFGGKAFISLRLKRSGGARG